MLNKNLENRECRELCGLFYSVFHDSLGRINVAQFPNFFPKELFDQVSNFVITKEDLANRVIVSKVDGKFVIGCLQSLENSKYPRNKFLFNVCFVVNEEVSDNLISYENLVRNLNRFFHSLEQETGKLHSADKETIQICLENIFHSLKTSGMCKYTWDGFGTIYLRMGAETEPSVLVESEQVPLLSLHADRHSDDNHRVVALDLTCQRLLPLLDGESRVWEIAHRSAVDLNVVRACVQNLGHIGAVRTVAPFRDSAVYMCMPRLRRAWRDTALRHRLVEHASEEVKGVMTDKDKLEAMADSALRALALLGANSRVSDCALMLSTTNAGINCKRLVQFAEIEGLIRRVHGYPIKVGLQESGNGDTSSGTSYDVSTKLLDGTHNLEEIACILRIPFDQLEAELAKVDDIFVIWN